MKKIIICLAFLVSINYINAQTADLAIVQTANTNTNSTTYTATQSKYYYYPTEDAYYDVATGNYWYYDVPTSSWISVSSLPSSYVIDEKTERFEILYGGTDVWKDHRKHRKIFKVKKNGQVVVRTNRLANNN